MRRSEPYRSSRASFSIFAEDSIFAEEVREEIEALAERLLGNVERIDRLLMVLSELRASVGRANAESGTAADALICLAIRRPRSQPAFVPTAGDSRIEPRVRDVRGGTI